MNEMAKVEGSFVVTLPVALRSLGNPILNRNVTACEFEFDNARVELSPGRFTDFWVDSETDELEPPTLAGIEVRVTRTAGVTRDNQGNRRLEADEEREFERIIIEATRRFVTAVKRKTRQWSLNTRYPIHSYDCTYLDTRLPPEKQFLLPRITGCLPQYWLESMTYDTAREFSGNDWAQVAIDVQHPVWLPLHEELIFEAESFRAQMRWDSTVLSAGIAIELMLKRSHLALLKGTGNLSDAESEKQAKGISLKAVVNEIAGLMGTFVSLKSEVQRLIGLRNDAAHARGRNLSSDDAAFAIRTARKVQTLLAPVLQE